MSEQQLAFSRVEISDSVATVTMARPKVNALSGPMMRELAGIFTGFAGNRDVSVAILTADGDRIFCAGADVAESHRRYVLRQLLDDESVADLVDPGDVVRQMFWGIRDCAVPVIAAVNGIALGAGTALAACCDLIVTSDTASFGMPEIDVGVLGGARHVQRLVGHWKMREMMFTGRRITAAELAAFGCVSAVVPPAELQAAARALAVEIAGKSPLALRMAKQVVNRVEDLSLKDGYQLEQDYTVRVTALADSKEARLAFQEKRAPTWTWS